MPFDATASSVTAPTQFLHGNDQDYAYRRFGRGALFQYPESFTRQATAFIAADSAFAPC